MLAHRDLAFTEHALLHAAPVRTLHARTLAGSKPLQLLQRPPVLLRWCRTSPGASGSAQAASRLLPVLQVPATCLTAGADCVNNPRYVQVRVPTRVRGASPGILWDFYAAGLRIIVRADLTIENLWLMYAMSESPPGLGGFMFTGGATLTTHNVTVYGHCHSDPLECLETVTSTVRTHGSVRAPHRVTTCWAACGPQPCDVRALAISSRQNTGRAQHYRGLVSLERGRYVESVGCSSQTSWTW